MEPRGFDELLAVARALAPLTRFRTEVRGAAASAAEAAPEDLPTREPMKASALVRLSAGFSGKMSEGICDLTAG